MSESEREFDILLWGVTGWTGVHLVEYFLEHYSAADCQVKWAMVCRSETKFNTVKKLLVSEYECFDTFKSEAELEKFLDAIPVLFVSNDDEPAITEVVKRSKSVASVVGPYAFYGEKLISQCAKNGTHYTDITGEGDWIAEMTEKYSAEAAANGAWLIPSCGFDSVPTELTTYICLKELRENASDFSSVKADGQMLGMSSGDRNTSIKNQPAGGGGTMATVMNFLSGDGKNKKKPEKMPANPTFPTKSADLKKLGLGTHRTLFPMAFVNQLAVYRSNKLLPSLYPKELIYTESAIGKSYMKDMLTPIGLGLGTLLLKIPGVAGFVAKKLPQPSQIPVKLGTTTRVHGSTEFITIATAKSGEKVYCKFTGTGDAGWSETSKMLAEAALAVSDETGLNAIKVESALSGGIVTAACLGTQYIERLKARGVVFTQGKL